MCRILICLISLGFAHAVNSVPIPIDMDNHVGGVKVADMLTERKPWDIQKLATIFPQEMVRDIAKL